jgi:transmembrane sensor
MAEADNRRADPVQRFFVPNWHPARLEKNLVRVAARVRQRRQGARFALAVAAAFTLLAAALFVLGRRPTTIAAPAPIASSDARILRFADGSSVELEGTASRVDTGFASQGGIDVLLQAGAARFEVTPQHGGHFVVHAGSIDVVVVGTIFRVQRAESRVHVGVERGRVEVRWQGGMRALMAGESAWFPAEAGTPSETPAEAEPEALPAPPLPPVTVDPHSERKRFVDHVNRGEYGEAFALLERSPDVVGNSLAELLLAADAARLSSHPAQALVYLERITKEYPRDARTPLAAFTMGRILMSQLGKPGRAADAFALTRRLAPRGPLAEDALAREAEATERTGARERARALSEEYQRLYPSGRRLSSVQQRGLRE